MAIGNLPAAIAKSCRLYGCIAAPHLSLNWMNDRRAGLADVRIAVQSQGRPSSRNGARRAPGVRSFGTDRSRLLMSRRDSQDNEGALLQRTATDRDEGNSRDPAALPTVGQITPRWGVGRGRRHDARPTRSPCPSPAVRIASDRALTRCIDATSRTDGIPMNGDCQRTSFDTGSSGAGGSLSLALSDEISSGDSWLGNMASGDERAIQGGTGLPSSHNPRPAPRANCSAAASVESDEYCV